MSLEWSEKDTTTDGRFSIQTERVRGESVYRYLMVHRAEDHRALVASDIETGFFGLSSRAKVKAAAEALVRLVDGEES